MTAPSPPINSRDFEIAVICALRIEADAVEALFDKFWEDETTYKGRRLDIQMPTPQVLLADKTLLWHICPA
jgi:hypothetical protein